MPVHLWGLLGREAARGDGLGRQEILGSGSGLRVVEVPHQGNTNASPEEALEVARLTEQPTGQVWRDKDGNERPVGPDDILVVTPYNAQIRVIQSALAASGQGGFRIGTVDKFQGREAPVVIYSIATSSGDHRGQPGPHPGVLPTPHQMMLANALCRAWQTQIE